MFWTGFALITAEGQFWFAVFGMNVLSVISVFVNIDIIEPNEF